jgi:hypothetical protein
MDATIAQQTQGATTVEVVTATMSKLRITYHEGGFPFVAKPIRVRTRKGKDYSVLRVTIPKEIASKLPMGPEDYLFLRATVAEWFHMLDWATMPEVWARLPAEVRAKVIGSGLPRPRETLEIEAGSPSGLALAAGSSGTAAATATP